MGKGSGRRPTDNKKFADNFDRIFNNKPNNKQFEGIDNGDKSDTKNTKKIKGKRRVSSGTGCGKVERLCKD